MSAVIPRGRSLRMVLGSPLYRGATVGLFLSGLGSSAAAPQIASFLVRELDASLTTAGLYYLTSLTAPLAGYLVGARSDRTGARLGLFRLSAVAGFLGWAGIGLSTQLWMPFLISTVVLAFAGAATSQLFAAVHDEFSVNSGVGNDGVVTIVRMALTAGWVVGPTIGVVVAEQFGLRAMLLLTAVFTLAQVLPLGTLRTPHRRITTAPGDGSTPSAARPGLAVMAPLLAFTGLYICVYAGEAVKYAFLPIHMRDQLHLAPGLAGAIIGIQPLVELALMPVAVIVARRIGMMRLMVVGAAMGVAANVCFAVSSTAIGLFAGQILMGGVWGVFAGLGIIVAQRLLPIAVATASAIFMSSTALSSALGGLAGGVGVGVLGLPLVFVVPATFSVIAVVGLAVMSHLTAVDTPSPTTG